MAEQDNRRENEVNYDHLIFDWKNPSMTARSSRRQTEPVPEPDEKSVPAEDPQTEDTGNPSESEAGEESSVQRDENRQSGTQKWSVVRLKVKEGEKESSEKKSSGAALAARLSRISRKKEAGRGKRSSGALTWISGHIRMIALALLILILVVGGAAGIRRVMKWASHHHHNTDGLPDYVNEEYLTINSYSRPGIATDTIRGIVVHYTADPGRTAQENRDYFEGLSESHETRASSNFIVGIEGEVIAAVPLGEVAYASNNRNMDTISIECCHPEEEGKFSDATYESLVKLTAWLCVEYNLSVESVIRHYDVSQKLCPKYYVEHQDAWDTFLGDVKAAMTENET